MLPKDLLNLVFWELDHGRDMINFSEINHRCHQIFNQNLEVVKKSDLPGDPIIFTRQKQTKHRHGLYRHWYSNGKLFNEENLYYGLFHSCQSTWWANGSCCYVYNYHYGQLHGRYREWKVNGNLSVDIKYHHGTKIEN